ncbi:DUF1127 domain-containing protein [Yoonia sp.]|uniref:DUF1127 domain-containing protein n=1 Tax=Yoonia sp. TaxID=2212373 RepID=UPI001A0925CD|nr:DUF1127 domain-containing protein [Yoonia sp.]MBE0412505.1 DUF1127 domain-containing protein [Yoonia sp.]
MTQVVHQNSICAPTPRQGSGIPARLGAMIAVTRQRRALRHLDDHLLADIGINHREAAAEAKRAAWDVPVYWRK